VFERSTLADRWPCIVLNSSKDVWQPYAFAHIGTCMLYSFLQIFKFPAAVLYFMRACSTRVLDYFPTSVHKYKCKFSPSKLIWMKLVTVALWTSR
jgi:hypothetical protein